MTRMRRIASAVCTVSLSTIVLVGLAASPAAAGSVSCANEGTYSFEVDTETAHNVFVHVFPVANCKGDFILDAQVQYDAGSPAVYSVDAYDDKCDNIGMNLDMHGYSIASSGCSNPGGFGEVDVSSIGSPRNFWLHVNGTTNSPAYNLPT